MTLRVIGAGLGRTGTMSLKIALEELGFGPCHHMAEVFRDRDHQVPLWDAALSGKANWNTTFGGFESAVDWPSAAFWRELADFYPDSKIILTTRDAENWFESISQTIFKLISTAETAPDEVRPVLKMTTDVITRSLGEDLERQHAIDCFNAHQGAVRREIPASRLLVFEAKDGWGPLCRFLNVDVPQHDYPRTNDRAEFWNRGEKPNADRG